MSGVSRRDLLRGRLGLASGARPAAPPASRAATAADLARLAAEAGLAHRLEDVRRLARHSVRLTHDPRGRSRLGGGPLAQVSLRELSALRVGAGLPTRGSLRLFKDAVEVARAAPRGGSAARASLELELPRAWHAAAQALGLSQEEAKAWQQLRERLARWQGVAPELPGAAATALHRLLGYPDETRGSMPLACELIARGFDVGGGHPELHPQAAAAAADAGRWRLLLQLSPDDALGWAWGPGHERLYLWTDAELPALGRVIAFAQ